ncbi:hypothetical protein [Pontibaca methylaminivorans]|uniref:Uncharacterized protein n=1 Tax=Pontibaca methylaminivorans TaxID=515897 RepID=A0A1R3W708_9RHOB|nr:hypothetical protein [Pontibaca methylaminivorans]SIT73654.1 hypothetical protein SAMN05421849_0016 [Pontibaca methylaminivorans]
MAPHAENADAFAREMDHPRKDIEKVDEPQLKAEFRTAAQVPVGLKTAFSDYEQKDAAAQSG